MTFIKLPPESPHAYRIECTACRTFVTWGTQAHLDSLEAQFGNIPVEEYRGDGAGYKIDQLYADRFAKS